MNNFLLKEALNNTWCSPRQNNQWVYSPTRVSKPSGELGVTKLLGRFTKLPQEGVYYQVFRVGQIDPEFLNLFRQNPDWLLDEWLLFSEAMEKKNIEVTIYNEYGVNLIRSKCYYRFTKDNCLFFLVPKIKGIPVNVETEQIYFRFYSNSSLPRSNDGLTSNFIVRYYHPQSINEILAIEQAVDKLNKLPGYGCFYVNGLKTNNFNYGNVKVGDHLEYVLDPSVRKVLTWKMNTLFNFKSERDNVYKYLLHYPGNNNWLIDYQDDIDIRIVIKRDNNYQRGVYYHRNARKNLRMITHKDYAIDSNMSMIMRDHLSSLLGLESIPTTSTEVEVVVRNSGDPRFLGFEANRIKELYKLPEAHLYGALLGNTATMPEWYCVNLEKSSFIDMLDFEWSKYNIDLIEKGYGYNAISKILGDSPRRVMGNTGTPSTEVPPGCVTSGTAYEYDSEGLLLGWYPFFNENLYSAKNNETRLIEYIVGEGDITTDTVYGSDNIPVDTNFDFRVYLCHLVNGYPNNKWEDITTSSLYEIKDGKVKWKGPGGYHWLGVRTDKKFLAYDYEVEINSGTLNFSILENAEGNPFEDLEVTHIPFAQLEIWLFKEDNKGRKLIRGLDYFVEWPLVYITNALYLNQESYDVKQKFHIRAHRLVNSDLKLDDIVESGWVAHGVLSDNGLFNVRDDRVLQVNVGGRTFHPKDVEFIEDNNSPKLLHPLNGFPYCVQSTIVPFNDFTNKSSYELRKPALEIDKRVSEYLTSIFGGLHPEGPSIIGRRYPVISPFLSHVLHLLNNKAFGVPEDRELKDSEVRERVSPYEWLLRFDPMGGNNHPDIRYAFTIPHSAPQPFVLEFSDYRFFDKVCSLYGYPGLVTNEYVTIKKY